MENNPIPIPKPSPTLRRPSKVKSLGVSLRSSEDEWYSTNESDLLDIWHAVEDSIKKRGIVMLDKCRFNHFCAFVMSMTTTQRDRCI